MTDQQHPRMREGTAPVVVICGLLLGAAASVAMEHLSEPRDWGWGNPRGPSFSVDRGDVYYGFSYPVRVPLRSSDELDGAFDYECDCGCVVIGNASPGSDSYGHIESIAVLSPPHRLGAFQVSCRIRARSSQKLHSTLNVEARVIGGLRLIQSPPALDICANCGGYFVLVFEAERLEIEDLRSLPGQLQVIAGGQEVARQATFAAGIRRADIQSLVLNVKLDPVRLLAADAMIRLRSPNGGDFELTLPIHPHDCGCIHSVPAAPESRRESE